MYDSCFCRRDGVPSVSPSGLTLRPEHADLVQYMRYHSCTLIPYRVAAALRRVNGSKIISQRQKLVAVDLTADIHHLFIF